MRFPADRQAGQPVAIAALEAVRGDAGDGVVVGGRSVGQFAAFLWFRFFDMVKPAPIRYYDRTLKGFGVRGGYGVMVDDILAAFYTLLVFALWRSF